MVLRAAACSLLFILRKPAVAWKSKFAIPRSLPSARSVALRYTGIASSDAPQCSSTENVCGSSGNKRTYENDTHEVDGCSPMPAQLTSPGAHQTTMATSGGNELVMDSFVMRQFTDASYTGTKVAYDPQEFEDKVNDIFVASGGKLVDGYAPFCKHVFIPNFAGVKTSTVRITPENEKLLVTGYEARTPQELPVLSRWFEAGSVETPEAKFLDIILYSREQIKKETAAMGKAEDDESTAPWGMISVKAQDVDHEIPMQPITMMRNALGKEEGGSGVRLDREKYAESVAFWRDHAPVK